MLVLFLFYPDGSTATSCQTKRECAFAIHLHLSDTHSVWILFIVSICTILVNHRLVAGTLVQEVERKQKRARLLIRDAPHKPTVAVALLASNRHVFANLAVRNHGTAPCGRATLYEGESWLSLVVLNSIGSHLERTVDHHELRELLGKSGMGMRALHHLREIENRWCEVRRSCQSTSERKRHCVGRWIATLRIPCIVFLSAHTLLRHEVRPCALDACRHGWFVVVNHDAILGSGFNHFSIMTNAIL